ncbi:MAG TPA: cache domain-containing protein [Gallionella sp.]|nr:cache domain-containing protein [Gallionella sp.]
MATLTKLRDALASFIVHSPFRWIALSLAAAMVVATAAYSYREIDRELTALTLSRREAVAQLMAATLTEKFGRVVDIAISLSTNPQLQNLVAKEKWIEVDELLHTVPQDLPHIDRLFITDTKGTLKADVPALPGAHGINLASLDWYREVSRNWQPYVSPAHLRMAAPQINIFAVASPVKTAAGQVTGILVLHIHIEKLLEWLAGIQTGNEASVYIVDSKGQMAFHSGQQNHKQITDLSANPVVQKLRRGEKGVEVGSGVMEQQESIVAYAPVSGFGWGVIVQQPVRSSMGLAARDTQLHNLLVGYGLILLLCAMTAILALRVVNARQREESDRLMKAELERQVAERTSELQVANRELQSFSYAVSHDLRAPLRSIDGFSQAVIEDYAGKLDDQGRDYLVRVRAATQRMGHLIDDMLALSRVTLAEMQRGTVDLSALAAEVIVELQKSEPERKVDWRIEPGLAATGDAHLLRVLLVNLLGNSWKFTGKTANATIEFGATRNAPIQNTQGTRDFFVRDNGAGFDMTYAGKLFGAFRRLHTNADFPGTGIGLATVQRIIHRHGGQVRGEGVAGHGATFYFSLPD